VVKALDLKEGKEIDIHFDSLAHSAGHCPGRFLTAIEVSPSFEFIYSNSIQSYRNHLFLKKYIE